MQIEQANTADDRTGSVRSVLIVEDETVVARDLERTLQDMGYAVIAAVGSAPDALRAIERRTPDVVLMDVRIAGPFDGIETAAMLHERWDVPVIFLTAYSDAQTVERAAGTAAYGYVVKPFAAREVRSAIEIACHKHAADRRLAQRERWFATVLRSIGDAVIACDCEQRVTFMNATAERLTGWSAGEALGHKIEEVARLVNAAGEGLMPVVERAMKGRGIESIPPACQLVARDGGRDVAVEDSVAAVVHGESLLGAVVVLRDVTEQRDLRTRIALGERMVSLGTLVAGVAHEINNPLTFVIGNVYGLARLLDRWQGLLCAGGERNELADARGMVRDVATGGERIARIVADLALFAAPARHTPVPVDPRSSLEWALRVTASTTRPRGTVTSEIGALPYVSADPGELGQVFVNLLTNAAQAIPEGNPSGNRIHLRAGTDERGWAVISVHDTGGGITEAIRPHIFDPFFTTKGPGAGTGLGLSIVHRIVAALGGDIQVESTEQTGTRFEVRLPGIQPRPAPALSPERGSAVRGRLLAIDDERAVLQLLARLLTDHDLTTVASAKQALELLRDDPGYDLVLCGLGMPEMSGPEFLDEVQRRFPALAPAVVFLAGDAGSSEAAARLSRLPNGFIKKPFTPRSLREEIERLLRAKSR